MVEMFFSEFFEDDDDDIFADAFKSISQIQSSSIESSVKETLKNNSIKKTDETHEKYFLPHASDHMQFDETESLPRSENIIPAVTNVDPFKNDKSIMVNHRFTPGYKPKSRKRLFPGPAGICVEEEADESSTFNSEPVYKKLFTDEVEVQDIISSQFLAEDVLQSLSWKKLQEEVSLNSSLFSTAKYYSIHRILKDTSKKKLPKHIIVPVLCVYLKEFNKEESLYVYMDDTGEINGKIDKEVLDLYGNFIKDGIALVLKQITFLCNIMWLEKKNLVSIYLDDGTVQHIQDWNIPVENEPLKLMSCPCKDKPEKTEKQTLEETKITPVLKKGQNITNTLVLRHCGQKNYSKSQNLDNLSPILPMSENLDTNYQHHSVFHNSQVSEHTDLENGTMDDFDKLLGNLDEESFLEDI